MIVNNNTTMIPRHVKHRAMTTTWPRHKPQEWSQGSPERLKMAGGCRRNPLICHTGGQNHGSPCVPIKSIHFTYANNCAYIYIFTYIYILFTYIHIYIYTYIIYILWLYIYICVCVCLFFIFISDIIWIFAHLFMIRCLCIYLLMCLRIYHCLFPYIYIYYSFTLLCAFVCVGPFLFSWSFKKISAPSLLMIPHFFSRLAASTNRK